MKKILLVILPFFCINYCNAQVSISLSKLNGTKWTIDDEEKIGEDTILYLNSFTQFSAYLPLINKRANFRHLIILLIA